MPLMQPAILGPLSELSTSVRVQGQLPGAAVTVSSAKRVVAKAIASSADQRLTLSAGVVLSRTEMLHATQALGNEVSAVPTGDQGTPVAPAPASASALPHVNVVTHLYACGRYVLVNGALPGATVTLSTTSKVLGTATADEGVARLHLTSPIPSASSIFSLQSAPTVGAGPAQSRVSELVPGGVAQLAPPVIQLPVRGCDAAVTVSGVVDGALVTLTRGSGTVDTFGFDTGGGRWWLSKALAQGDTLTIRQDVDLTCKRPGKTSAPIPVGAVKPVDAPEVMGPLCMGATCVLVRGLRPGAIIHLLANGQSFDGAAPAGQTSMLCGVPALLPGAVSATQTICGVTSPQSALVAVDLHQADVPAPLVLGPLFACAGTVSVTNAHVGAKLQVCVRGGPTGWYAISGHVFAASTNVVIPVAPLLIADTRVFVRQWACSDTSAQSPDAEVWQHPSLATVELCGPLVAGDVSVGVRGAVAGGVVEVFGVGAGAPEFLGSASVDALHSVTLVALSRPLVSSDSVASLQRMCSLISNLGAPMAVSRAAVFGKRPFYVFGHNPNTIKEVKSALAAGANALEPDLSMFWDDPGRICVHHDGGGTTKALEFKVMFENGLTVAPSLVDYLVELRAVAVQNPQLALVVFDCKEGTLLSPDHGFELLMAIRSYLTYGTDLNVIISIGHPGDGYGAFFDRIVDILGPREGLMIDAEDEPAFVTSYFTARGVDHQGYGDGFSWLNDLEGPSYRICIEEACGLRAAAGRLKFIYVWSVNSDDASREYIRIGVDGIITDEIEDLVSIVAEPEFSSQIQLAKRSDNPLRPANFAYGLRVHTGTEDGTDANLTFTLHGSRGSASKTINSRLINRMETGDSNWITVPSFDLGTLQTMTVQRDDQGNDPNWFLDRIEIRSHRFGVSGLAVFKLLITTTAPVTRAIVP
jgi:glycerophosphoryl diester phosphodiesterase